MISVIAVLFLFVLIIGSFFVKNEVEQPHLDRVYNAGTDEPPIIGA